MTLRGSATRRSSAPARGIFHNRVTLNDSTLLGGNPPFQPQVTIANGTADNPAGGSGELGRPAVRHQRPGSGVQAPDVATCSRPACSAKCRSASSSTSPTCTARASTCSASASINQLQPGTLQANPNVNIAALRPYTGYGAIRISENSGRSSYNSLQISADRRYSNGLKVGFAYTLGKSEDNGSDKRNVLWNTYDDTNFWGVSQLRPPSRAELLLHLRSAVLPRPEPGPDGQPARRLADLGRHVLPHRHAVLRRQQQQRHRGRRRRRQRPAVEPRGRRQRGREQAVLERGERRQLLVQHGGVRARRRPARSATRRATCSTTRASSSGTWRSSRTSRWAASRRVQFRAEAFNFINHPNWDNVQTGTLPGSLGFAHRATRPLAA